MELPQQVVTNPALIWVLIPITYFLVNGICEFTKLVQRHQERMALIRQGIYPDLIESDERPDTSPVNHNKTDSPHVIRETVDYRS